MYVANLKVYKHLLMNELIFLIFFLNEKIKDTNGYMDIWN